MQWTSKTQKSRKTLHLSLKQRQKQLENKKKYDFVLFVVTIHNKPNHILNKETSLEILNDLEVANLQIAATIATF